MSDHVIDINEPADDFVAVYCPTEGCRTGMTVHKSVVDEMLARRCAEHNERLVVR